MTDSTDFLTNWHFERKTIFTISEDGELTFGEHVTPIEAAQCIADNYSELHRKQAEEIKGLSSTARELLLRVGELEDNKRNAEMTATDLAELVRQMRTAQKTYFRERSPQCLSVSKELERRVDKAVSDVLEKQGRLFGG